jgi:protein-export membrane protein SecD
LHYTTHSAKLGAINMNTQYSGKMGINRKGVIRRMWLLLAIAIVAAAIAYPSPVNWLIGQANTAFRLNISPIKLPYVLGLDLQGGSRLEYSADVSSIAGAEQGASIDGVRDVIERRVNTLGVSEPLVQTAKAGDEWRVSVELAGIRDINQAIKLIGETPILEFKEQNDEPARQLTDDERKKMKETNEASMTSAQDALKLAVAAPNDFEQLVKESSQEDTTKAKGGDLGFIKDAPQFVDIYEVVKQDSVGSVHAGVIETPSYNVVAKVEEEKDAGSEMKGSHLLISFSGAVASNSTTTKEAAKARIEEIKKQITPENFVELAKKYSQEPGAAESGGDLGWFGKNVMVTEFENPAFALAKGQISDIVETQFGYHLIIKQDERPLKDVRVRAAFFKKVQESDIVPPPDQWKNTELTGRNLKRSQLDFDQYGGSAQVSLQFDDEGTKLFADITRRNIGKPVAIFLDGQPISIPTVNSEIPGGQAVITGSFSIQEAKLLAQRLNAGALPVPITLIAQQSVGPTLGQDSINSSLKAAMYGLILVALFMILFYRFAGLIAVLTLGLYVAISLAIFKLLPVTLTLSGIAGFILSVGMAVDANVLIFERFKEERALGKALRNALEESFVRAWPSIRDGNLTTLISCAALYWFTSSVIKGFALTLAIGVMLSMFSAVVATRTVFRFLSAYGVIQNTSWLFPGRKPPKE